MPIDPVTGAVLPYVDQVRQALGGAANTAAPAIQNFANAPYVPQAASGAPAPAPTYDDWAAQSGITRSADAPPEGAPMTAPVAPPPVEGAPRPPPQPGEGLTLARAGGAVPAHERSLLGPTQWAALEAGNQSQEQAIRGMSANNAAQTASDEEVYLAHARDARLREDAANSAALEREEELNRRAMDFDRMAKQLSQERIDPDHFWASRSTPQKIAAFLSIGLGGFVQGARGGSNVGLDMVNNAIERDIRAQEFAYKAKRDSLEAQSTAFGMAMHRYQSVDAARSFARVAAMDAVAAEVQRQAAKGKGTEAANRALAALAELDQMRAQQIVKGIQFVPTTYAEPKYRIPGRVGTYTAKEVDALIGKEEERGFELQKLGVAAGYDIEKETAKAGVKSAQDARAEMVTLPNGDTIRAPTSAEATKLRDLSAAVDNANQLVAEAKRIRSQTGWWTSKSNHDRLSQIQSELTLAFKDRGQLGALSGPDMGLAEKAIGDLTTMNPLKASSVDAQLDMFSQRTDKALRNRVKSIPGVPDTAAGKMPKSFSPANIAAGGGK